MFMETEMKEQFEINLKKMFKQSDSISFTEFVIDKYFIDHRKSVQMAGDLGKAFSDIGDLKREIMTIK